MVKKEKNIILYMAPILGISNSVYRNAYSRFFKGYDYAVTPFIASRAGSKATCKYIKDILPERNKVDFKIIPQIIGRNSDDFIVLATIMSDLGYDVINWNLGCPIQKVRNKKRGSGLLAYPEEIEKFLERVVPCIPNKLSVKVRLGSETKTDLPQLIPIFNNFPLEEIIIHPRTGKQMYKGAVDLNVFEECAKSLKHRIVYNGDINSVDVFCNLAKRFPLINRWMIGRGGIVNPFLPEMIKNVKLKAGEEKLDRFISFHNFLLSVYQQELHGPRHLMDKMKELWSYWYLFFDGGKQMYSSLCRVRDIDKFISKIDAFFASRPSLI